MSLRTLQKGKYIFSIRPEHFSDAPRLGKAPAGGACEITVEYFGDAVNASVIHVIQESRTNLLAAPDSIGGMIVYLAKRRQVTSHKESPACTQASSRTCSSWFSSVEEVLWVSRTGNLLHVTDESLLDVV